MTSDGLDLKISAGALVLPGGLTLDDLFHARSAVVGLDESFRVPIGAPVTKPLTALADAVGRPIPRGVLLAAEALAALPEKPKRRTGLVLGLPSLFSETEYVEHMLVHRHDVAAMERLHWFLGDHPLHLLQKRFGLTGPAARVDSACATGNDALIQAGIWLQQGLVDDVWVVAASAMLNPVAVALFDHLKALTERRDLEASCPFDARRRGFVMGEGAAALCLSRRPEARALGYLRGWGQSMSDTGFVDLPDDLRVVEGACRAALGGRDRVAYVSAHGTATQANDLMETRLHHRLFGKAAPSIPLSSIKSMIGHCLGAAALIEAWVCLAALHRQTAPPTINLRHPDPACDLDVVPNQARPIAGALALSNAFAFGGHNVSVLLERGEPWLD
ncbi:beta-ketoacyl-[acyl-carrier-protein] synthase family protein [Acanthopleuribacter pedis]|uniref:Ketosynthase family 3 (KS3) domain-containing protein n=1 Tax=Acanthopleuribacter pedis TaxID=442870 RepID=A0A8J7Q1J8_9BACT|nr:beta-ketoacyl synthase N-terminal-like domain-containing protein [Acanthopleuribacter pedis]MBO1317550.1 hypothetical protein [Acanthopleuribacter pedis]